MVDADEAGDVVAALHALVQRQQAHEHGGHHQGVGDAAFLDARQHPLGPEAGLDHQVAAHVVDAEEPAIGRGVIGGPGDQEHHVAHPVLPALEPADDAQHLARGLDLLRRGRQAAHALGVPGGAGGVDHRAGGDGEGRLHLRVGGDEIGPDLHPLGHGRLGVGDGVVLADQGGRGGGDQPDARGDRLAGAAQQVGMGDHRLGAAVAQHVAHLLGRVVPVHRDHVGADEAGGEGGGDELEAVAHQHGDHVALAHAHGAETRGGAAGLGVDLGMGARLVSDPDPGSAGGHLSPPAPGLVSGAPPAGRGGAPVRGVSGW